MQPEDVQAAIAAAPLSATQALQRGLVNELCYFDQVLERITQVRVDNAGTTDSKDALPTVDLARYLRCVRQEQRLDNHSVLSSIRGDPAVACML